MTTSTFFNQTDRTLPKLINVYQHIPFLHIFEIKNSRNLTKIISSGQKSLPKSYFLDNFDEIIPKPSHLIKPIFAKNNQYHSFLTKLWNRSFLIVRRIRTYLASTAVVYDLFTYWQRLTPHAATYYSVLYLHRAQIFSLSPLGLDIYLTTNLNTYIFPIFTMLNYLSYTC